MVVPDVRGASALLLVLVAAQAACSFDASFDGTRYRCGAGGTCPARYTCVADECVAPSDVDAGADDGSGNGSGDGGAGDGGAGDGGASAPDASPPDGPSVRFSDTFDDGALSGWLAWTNPGCTVAETNGALELAYSGSGGAYCGADTAQSYDLRTGSVSVEVVEAPLVNTFEAYLILFDATQQIHMIRATDGLRMQLKLGNTVMASRTIANPAGVRFWRVRTLAGTTIWETSNDGVAWTQRHSTTVAIDVRAMQIELAAGHYSPGPGSPVRARFDRVTIE